MKSDVSSPKESTGSDIHVSDETLRGFVGYHIKRAFNVIQSDLARTLKPFELRMITYSALVLIVDNPGLRQSQLADALAIERPNMVVIIDQLEQRELISRNRVPSDRRAYALKATMSGRRLYQQAQVAVNAHENRMLTGLDAQTKTTLIAALGTIRNSSKGTP